MSLSSNSSVIMWKISLSGAANFTFNCVGLFIHLRTHSERKFPRNVIAPRIKSGFPLKTAAGMTGVTRPSITRNLAFVMGNVIIVLQKDFYSFDQFLV